MITIAQHGSNHPALQDWIVNEDWAAIANWYNSYPDSDISTLTRWMSLSDRVNFYRLGLVREWYADLCESIIDETNLAPVLNFNQDYITKLAIDLIDELNGYGVVAMNLTEAIQNLFRRYALGADNVSGTLYKLLICLVSSKIFSEYTGLMFYVDLQPATRRTTMGYTEPISASQCEIELGD